MQVYLQPSQLSHMNATASKSPATRLYVQHTLQANINEIMETLHYWPFLSGIPLFIDGFPSQSATKNVKRFHFMTSSSLQDKMECLMSCGFYPYLRGS